MVLPDTRTLPSIAPAVLLKINTTKIGTESGPTARETKIPLYKTALARNAICAHLYLETKRVLLMGKMS
jgi:hypothetical protein